MCVLVCVHCEGVGEQEARGGDKAGIHQVEEVSRGRVRIRVGERDRSDEMRSVMMRGRSAPGISLGRQGKVQGAEQSLLVMRGH